MDFNSPLTPLLSGEFDISRLENIKRILLYFFCGGATVRIYEMVRYRFTSLLLLSFFGGGGPVGKGMFVLLLNMELSGYFFIKA